MARINPPPQNPIPPELKKTEESRGFFERNQMILFQMWKRIGGPRDAISDIESNTELVSLARIDAIDQRIGSGDALTFDDDGFTWDADVFSWDEDEA